MLTDVGFGALDGVALTVSLRLNLNNSGRHQHPQGSDAGIPTPLEEEL